MSAKTPIENTPDANAPGTSEPGTSTPSASAPIASAPIASAPIANAPIANAPIANAPIANAPIANAPRAGRSVIGIPAALGRPSETGYIHQQVGAPYVHALEKAGALALLLPVSEDLGLIDELLDRVDGILLQGGGDIDPLLYGEEPLPMIANTDRVTDQFELELCRRTLRRDLPLLAICRGVQVLNVALGGSLVQDLPSVRPSEISHRQPPPRSVATHEIRVEPGSRLAGVLGETHLAVNTFHHQAIDTIAPGLVVSAHSEDGVVEAVESPSNQFVIGVQFHPEETVDSVPPTARLFRELVGAARTARRCGRRFSNEIHSNESHINESHINESP